MEIKTGPWNLNDIIKKEDIPECLKKVEQIVKQIEKFKPKFKTNISLEDFNKIIELLEKQYFLMSKAGQYSSLWVKENTKNSEALALQNKISKINTEQSNRLLWLSLELVKFKEKDLKRLIDHNKKINYSFRQLVKLKPFFLSEKEEKIINYKDYNGINTVIHLYNLITSDFTFKFKGREITQNEVIKEVRSPDKKTRKLACETLLKKYKENEIVLNEIYTAIAGDWEKEYIVTRKYKSPISVRNRANDIPDKAIEVLLKTTEKNQKVFHRYFKLKARLLKTKKLSRFDLYAPIKFKEQKITYKDAVSLIVDTFNEFSPIFSKLAKRMVATKHIHSSIQRGKTQGAFCSSAIPSVDPFILLNYVNNEDSMETLAHELGHAIHFMLAAKKQSIFHTDAALPVAETASTLCELIVLDKMKRKYPKLALKLLLKQLDRSYGTIARQAEITSFEIKAHELVKHGTSLNELKKVRIDSLRKHFGPNVEVPELYASELHYIPHIYNSPFYCYAYSFGDLLSLAVYKKYRENSKTYIKKIIKMLSDGGSKSPADLVKELGFDIGSEKFWQSGFDYINSLIDQAEKLT